MTDLDGATICTLAGATLELNIADYNRARNVKITPLLFDKADEALSALEAGRCDGYTDDTGSLAGARSSMKKPGDWVVLGEVISKEPLGLLRARGRPVDGHRRLGAKRADHGRGTRYHAG